MTQESWINIIVPVAIVLAFLIIGLWARRVVYNNLQSKLTKMGWGGRGVLIQSTRGPFFFWFLILGCYVAVQVSILQENIKEIAGRVLASIFIISIIWLLMILTERLLNLYLIEIKTPSRPIRYIVNGVRITLLVLGVLILIDFWGWPVTPIILVLAAAILTVIVATRDALADIFSGFELVAGRTFKEGDFIKLGSSEEGYVTDMGWRNTLIKTLDQQTIVIPNSKLVRDTITNFGRPLTKSSQPFRFFTRLQLKELTGLRAASVPELLKVLKNAPDSVIYYHTHNFLEEHQYLTPEPDNDFALWVYDSLDLPVLSEKLANIDTLEYTSLGALRSAIITVIERYLADEPKAKTAKAGVEFNFIKSVIAVIPTPYYASDLREFVEILRKITIDSLYFHIFESRLRLKSKSNDFSTWMRTGLGENDLADQIEKLVPYTTTLEGLRSTIIRQVEKRIK